MSKLSQAIKHFMTYIEFERNMSPKTRENYNFWLQRLVEFTNDRNVQELSALDILSWRQYLHTTYSLSTKTINFHVIAVRALLKFLLKHDYQVMSPEKLELAKTPSREVSYLTLEEITRLLDGVEQEYLHNQSRIAARDCALIHTLYGSGLRVSEVVALQWKDLPTD
jgi:site-specific recombinase XerD